MATLTEVAVKVAITIERDPVNGDHVVISGYSVAGDGTPLRSESGFDVTSLMTTAQKAEATDLLNAAEAYYKSKWSIV